MGKILGLLTPGWFGLPKLLWIVITAIAIYGVIEIYNNKKDSRNQEIGATKERTKSQQEVLKNVSKAKTAEGQISDSNTVIKYCQCVRSARTPANCKRYLPYRHKNSPEPSSLCEK